MHEYHSKISAVLAVYRIARTVGIAQEIMGGGSALHEIRDAIIRYMPVDECKTILPFLDNLIAGRMPDPAQAVLVISAIEQLDSDIKRDLQ